MGESLKKMGEGSMAPKLLDLMIPNERDWAAARPAGGRIDGAGDDEEKRLELKLGLPGGEDTDPSLLSIRSFSKLSSCCSVYTTDQGLRKENGEAKQQVGGGSPASGNKADMSQARPVFVPAVGWPPIRSYRRNLANPPKPSLAESKKGDPGGAAAASEVKDTKKGFFVKINMDGVPIGRKVDLYAYDSYEKLSLAVDELFSGLLAAQRDPLVDGAHENPSQGSPALSGLLDGSCEYTLVYEDNEGDRMLVGDVPWVMFVSTAKRLRVLKSSELSAFSLGGAAGRKRAAAECC